MFELAENVLYSLHSGDVVVVYERTASWGVDGHKRYGGVIDTNLARATAALVRTPRAPTAL